MTGQAPRVRRTRSDYERNRVEILDQAERHFTDHGVGASLEAVARDAGVGSATLYRHFPNRDALLAELLERRASHIAYERARIDELDDSGEALEQWTAAMEEFFGAFDGLPGPLRTAIQEEHHPLALTCEGFVETTDHFVAAAQRDGRAAPWLRGRDLFLATLALSWARGSALADEAAADQLRRLVQRGYEV